MKIKKQVKIAIFLAVGLVLTVYFSVHFIKSQAAINASKAEYELLKQERDDLRKQNDETEQLLRSGESAENLEKVAREKYGYVYPDERVYYIDSYS